MKPEASLVTSILDALHRWGWIAVHHRPAMLGRGGWRTALEGSRGDPDILAVHPVRGVLFVECKSDVGRLSEDQVRWAQVLDAIESVCPHVRYEIVTPRSWSNGHIDRIIGIPDRAS